MTKRLLTAAVGVPLILFILFLDNSLVITIAVSLLSILATYEILIATKYLRNLPITATCLLFVGAAPFILSYDILHPYVPIISMVFLILLFTIMIFAHNTVNFEEIAVMAFVSICFPLSFGSLAFTQIRFEQHGVFYLVFIFTSTWIGDAGAFFVGTFFGKHKMAPSISPKKSWEGFVGGIVSSGIFSIIISILYEAIDYMTTGTNNFKIDLIYLFLLSIVCSVLGVLGDFTASFIKRQCSVKDFGSIFPGHGGILDRFDSILFAAPLVYVLFKFHEPISAIV